MLRCEKNMLEPHSSRGNCFLREHSIAVLFACPEAQASCFGASLRDTGRGKATRVSPSGTKPHTGTWS